MSEMPQDIFATAFATLSTIQMDHADKWESWDGDASLELIAEALTAERRRCAQILIDNFAPSQGESMDRHAVQALAAIRRGTP